jgi:hypothetical protein
MKKHVLESLLKRPSFSRGFHEHVSTLKAFHHIAGKVLGNSLRLEPLPDTAFEIDRHFFSTFFLAVTDRLTGGSSYLPLYAMVNQGMRAWVTASDNILDDEYNSIFPFVMDRGNRMRSVLTLMLADRVVTEYVAGNYEDPELLVKVGRVSLKALISSARQECEEEARPVPVLSPHAILEDIHVRKTGDLFLSPLALPLALEAIPPRRAGWARSATKNFGLACQILDDIKDLPLDVRTGRHNLVLSILCRDVNGPEDFVRRLLRKSRTDWTAWERFPDAFGRAMVLAVDRFEVSFKALARLGIEFSATEGANIVELMCDLLNVPASILTGMGVSM